jgi:hypothetical protein
MSLQYWLAAFYLEACAGLLDYFEILRFHSLSAIDLQGRDIRRELLYLSIQASHLCAEFISVNADLFVSI